MKHAVESRAAQLLADHQNEIHCRVDRVLGALLVVEWLLGILMALYLSPRAWAGTATRPHLHLLASIFLGGLIVSLPLILVAYRPGAAPTRHLTAAAQMLMGALFIHLSGGRIETHFHVFGSLALVFFYRDWRVLLTATTVVVTDHLLRGLLWPQSVYGVLSVQPWRFLEHAGWVAFEDLFLIGACLQAEREMSRIARQRAQLETTNAVIEQRILERTQSLQASEARFKALAAWSPVAILQADQAGQCVYSNPQWSVLSGQGPAASLGSGWMSAVHDQDRADLTARWKEAFDHKIPFAHEFRLARPEGEVCWVLVQSGMILEDWANGQVCSVSDISARKLAAQEQARARQAAEAANAAKSDFLANMSHELRTPLNAIIGFSEILSEQTFGPLNAKQTKYVGNVLSSGRHLLRLINDVLDLSKVEAGHLEALPENVDVEAALRDAESIMAGLAASKNITLQSEVAPELPSAFADRQHVKQILYNLLSNAVKFTPPGGQVVLTALERDGLQISVKDNGIGIAPEDQKIGIALAKSEQPDLILMDLSLPGLDGLAATRILRQDALTCNIPIVAVTAHAMGGDAERVAEAGCLGYLTKPIDTRTFVARVESFLRGA